MIMFIRWLFCVLGLHKLEHVGHNKFVCSRCYRSWYRCEQTNLSCHKTTSTWERYYWTK